MNCTICGAAEEGMLTMFNLSSQQSTVICGRCSAKAAAQEYSNPDKIEKYLVELREMATFYEELIKTIPEMTEVPKELSAIACTPLTEYRKIQYMIAEYETHKIELITQKESMERLNYELKKSIEKEDYQKAAEIRDKLLEKKDKIDF